MGGGISSHKYVNQIIDEASLEVLHKELITYRKEETKIKFEKIANAIGDMLPVKIVGYETGYDIGCKNWDVIVELMSTESLFFALANEPELMHTLAQIFVPVILHLRIFPR